MFFFFSGLLDWIMLIMVWFERFFPPPQVRWQSYLWPLKLMTSKVVEGTWIQAQVVQGWMGQYTAQQTAGTSKIKKLLNKTDLGCCFLTSSRSLRKLLNVGTNSILVISLPRTNASSWIEKANVLLTFHYKTKIKSIKIFWYRIILLYNFLSNCWFTSDIMAAMLIDRNKTFSDPGNFICFHVKKSIRIVLTPNIATVTQGCGGNMAAWLECWIRTP